MLDTPDGAGARAGRSTLRLLPRSARWPLRAGAAMLEWVLRVHAIALLVVVVDRLVSLPLQLA
jgi:hypothetical protein